MEQINEYQYKINGVIYDSRDSWEYEKYILPNLDKLKEGKKEDVKIEIQNDFWEVPINTKYLNDKNMDFRILAIMTLFSNRKGEEVVDDYRDIEEHRYIYEKGDNSIMSNKKEIIELFSDENELSKNAMRRLKRGMKKLVECGNDVVMACEDEKGNKYYIIQVKHEGKYFVKIDERMLRFLIDTSNSNVIKTYCVLKILLWNNEKQCYTKRQLTRDFLLKQIGLTNCENSLKAMTNILQALENHHLIKREKKVKVVETNNGTITKTLYSYELIALEDFLKFNNKK